MFCVIMSLPAGLPCLRGKNCYLRWHIQGKWSPRGVSNQFLAVIQSISQVSAALEELSKVYSDSSIQGKLAGSVSLWNLHLDTVSGPGWPLVLSFLLSLSLYWRHILFSKYLGIGIWCLFWYTFHINPLFDFTKTLSVNYIEEDNSGNVDVDCYGASCTSDIVALGTCIQGDLWLGMQGNSRLSDWSEGLIRANIFLRLIHWSSVA